MRKAPNLLTARSAGKSEADFEALNVAAVLVVLVSVAALSMRHVGHTADGSDDRRTLGVHVPSVGREGDVLLGVGRVTGHEMLETIRSE